MKLTRKQLAAVRRKVLEFMDRRGGLRCEVGYRRDGPDETGALTTNAAKWPDENDLADIGKLHEAVIEADRTHVLDVYVYGRGPDGHEEELLTNVFVLLRGGEALAAEESWTKMAERLEREPDGPPPNE